jgi:hypothetical protein
MSDIGKITASRHAERETMGYDKRPARAAEQTADALEGIRQDITLLNEQLGRLIRVMSELKPR